MFAHRANLSNLLNVYWPYACFAIVCSTFSHLVFPPTTVGFLSAGRSSPKLPFRVVGSNGLGPSTSRLSGVCSNQLSYEPISFFPFSRFGGGNRVRTDDPLLAGQVLYQLSHTPNIFLYKINAPLFLRKHALLKMNKKEISQISVLTWDLLWTLSFSFTLYYSP